MLNHVQNDHNMWSYIYYFMYLNELEESDYSALDMYVAKLVRNIFTIRWYCMEILVILRGILSIFVRRRMLHAVLLPLPGCAQCNGLMY